MIKYLGIFFGLIISIVFSCTSENSNNRGHLQVMLQDASAPFDSILINIQKFQIHPDIQSGDSSSGWLTLFDSPTTYNMVKLRNGIRTQLCNREIVGRTYKTIRLQLGACFAVRNDTLYNLEFWDESLKTMTIDSPIKVVNGQTTRALIDINLYESISYVADSSRFYFEPSFTFYYIDSTGGIEGYIIPKSDVYLTYGGDTLGMTTTESDNYFGFFGLLEGYYSIYIFPRDTANYRNWLVENIPVHPDTSFDVGLIELPPR